MKIKITYEIDDGYCGSRPKYAFVEVDEEDWNSRTEDEKQELAQEEADADFQNRIFPFVKRYEVVK